MPFLCPFIVCPLSFFLILGSVYRPGFFYALVTVFLLKIVGYIPHFVRPASLSLNKRIHKIYRILKTGIAVSCYKAKRLSG